jgi:indolepyruvate ferredoxin oxidoreductase, beta subunit
MNELKTERIPMDAFNIYLAGVGGQGIGMLSEIIVRAADHAGLMVRSVDTHGLAQRGGVVVSQVRIGPKVFTPLIAAHSAHLVAALERHEALRALNQAAAAGATLVYYDTVWQPLPVRLKEAPETTAAQVEAACREKSVKLFRIHRPEIKQARMQNMAVLHLIDREQLIPGIQSTHYRQAMGDLMTGAMLEHNSALFGGAAPAA